MDLRESEIDPIKVFLKLEDVSGFVSHDESKRSILAAACGGFSEIMICDQTRMHGLMYVEAVC